MKSSKVKLIAVTLALLFVLGACTSISFSTAWALRNMDYLTIDTGPARLALSLPDGAILDEATLTLKFTEDGEVKLDHTIALDIITEGREIDRVGFPAHINTKLVLRVPRDQVATIANFQNTLSVASLTQAHGSASIGIDSRLNQEWVKTYCAAGNTEFRIQTWIRVEATDEYLPLTKDSAIFQLLKGQSQSFCPK